MGKVKVLVVDDSAFMRQVITNHLAADPELEVVGSARDGLAALEAVSKLHPDVVTLDVEMPKLDGLGTLRRLMAENPLPVVMVSALTQEGAAATVEALQLGAVDFVHKPSGSVSLDFHRTKDELVRKVKQAAKAKVHASLLPRLQSRPPKSVSSPARLHGNTPYRAVVVGSSTGGPRALHAFLTELPAWFPVPMLIVQHMPPGFTRSLAARLNEACAINVKEAEPGDRLQPGLALLAPGNFHLLVKKNGVVDLDQGPTVHGVRPSVDVTLKSAVEAYGRQLVAVIMTGMGVDGSEGAAMLHRLGGAVIAEHESSCVVYGMPRAVVEAGNADRVVPLPQIASALLEVLQQPLPVLAPQAADNKAVSRGSQVGSRSV